MYLINSIISGLLFFILALISSRFPNKRLILITTINALLFGIIYYSWQTNVEWFRDNLDDAFKADKVYYYDTVPTTDKCDTGNKEKINFYYNPGTEEKHFDASNNTYICKKIVIQPKFQGYGRGYAGGGDLATVFKPIIKYEITPVVLDPSFNCPESLDYDNNKKLCVLPPVPLANFNDKLPRKYKCPHAVGEITYRYGDDDIRSYSCDLSGNKNLIPNDKECPPGLKRINKKCK